MKFETAEDLRAFLRTAIDPGPGRDKRTPTRLVEALPDQYAAALGEFAPPYLAAFGRTAADLTARAEDMRHAYAATVLAWIRDEEPSDRLLDLATEATEHARSCAWCTRSGVLSATCEDGRRLAAALLAPAKAPEDRAQHCTGAALTHDETGICNHPVDQDEEPPCAHESWDVTSEYPALDGSGWVKFRRCNDCREPLGQICEPAPHFEENGSRTAAAAAAGHRTVAETTAAYVTAVPEADQPTGDEEERPALPPALPWTNVLKDEEPFELLGELNLVLQEQHPRREGETHGDRARRILAEVDRVLGSWRDAMEHRRPTTYVTDDGRAWTYQGEHHANEGAALYESPTSPKAYSALELAGMYRWVAAIEGGKLGDGETVTAPFEDYARTCRVSGLTPFTNIPIRSGSTDTVHAAVHIALSPDLELSTEAVDAVRTAVCDGLAYRDE